MKLYPKLRFTGRPKVWGVVSLLLINTCNTHSMNLCDIYWDASSLDFIQKSHLAVRALTYCCFIQNMSTQATKEAWTYCGQLVGRLGIGIRTQAAVDVWAHEGRECNQAEVGQGAAGLQG